MENKIKAPTKNESRAIKFMILLGIFSILVFLNFFFKQEHIGNTYLFILLTITILYSILKKLYMWYNYSNISVPESAGDIPDLKVDILTTYFPGEPYQMTITTLEAISNITYPHTTYLCDEANDPYLKAFCEKNNIIHVTRDNRIDAKAGNINNALVKHATGDICVVLDPDHIPEPNFLDPILPHFKNPEIGFVQIVQSYYNIKETLVARGAAEQTFQFYGPMMMTLNSYGAVNAIGANCVFRRTALDSIGGHAPGLCEDMHTAMLLYSKGWKAIYLPEVLARGLAPSNLTNFFKQQLKWSRGTFDLLVHVYPKIFSKLTGRQKIHYGILPLHYLGGVISFINFLIPILSLFFTTTPWTGNIIDFSLVLIPVAASSSLIRTYIQKWVIEKKERGFHLVGGLLHINTWWIYIVGLVYTIINKNVPYLPTPKENEWNTNYKIIIPNAIIALISIAAVVYGLNQDLTPFSLVMAGFALFNAFIMIFGIYLTNKVTNQNRILRNRLGKTKISFLWNLKKFFYRTANTSFVTTRKIALPLLLLLLIGTMNLKNVTDRAKWENLQPAEFQKESKRYLGIYHPFQENGLSDLQEINYIENEQDINFGIISYYLAWGKESIEEFPHELLQSTYDKNAIPMITWEPWIAELSTQGSRDELKAEKKAFKRIAEGEFDDYIVDFIQILGSYEKPIFLRFGHEFDNPQYPWSAIGDNTPEEFRAAWIHIHKLIKAENAGKIIMVWNPWKAGSMAEYYPGDDYVDWVGITMLNYSSLGNEGKSYKFDELYEPFKTELALISGKISTKPVMLAEFGSLNLKEEQDAWIDDAINSITKNHEEISAIVMFNSAFDKNIPDNDFYTEKYLNWTVDQLSTIAVNFNSKSNFLNSNPNDFEVSSAEINPITNYDVKGIHYKKGKNWRHNYYALTKDVLKADFQLLKETGINTIQYSGSNIYDHNLLKYSKDFNLKVIYEFDLPITGDYIKDKEKLQKEKLKILEQVKELRSHKNVIAYSFRYDLETYYDKPFLFEKRTGIVLWLTNLITEIREIDAATPVVLEIALNNGTTAILKSLRALPIDSYGLIVKDTTYLNETLVFGNDQNIPLYISSIDPEIYLKNLNQLQDRDVILKNWQDERESNWLSFDGIVDFEGNKKTTFAGIENTWAGKDVKIESHILKILKPAEPLFPKAFTQYHALILTGGKWFPVAETSERFDLEWHLIKTDNFGNPLAAKKIGEGPTIEIEVPENYTNYELILIVKKSNKDYVSTSRSQLHTPAL